MRGATRLCSRRRLICRVTHRMSYPSTSILTTIKWVVSATLTRGSQDCRRIGELNQWWRLLKALRPPQRLASSLPIICPYRPSNRQQSRLLVVQDKEWELDLQERSQPHQPPKVRWLKEEMNNNLSKRAAAACPSSVSWSRPLLWIVGSLSRSKHVLTKAVDRARILAPFKGKAKQARIWIKETRWQVKVELASANKK